MHLVRSLARPLRNLSHPFWKQTYVLEAAMWRIVPFFALFLLSGDIACHHHSKVKPVEYSELVGIRADMLDIRIEILLASQFNSLEQLKRIESRMDAFERTLTSEQRALASVMHARAAIESLRNVILNSISVDQKLAAYEVVLTELDFTGRAISAEKSQAEATR